MINTSIVDQLKIQSILSESFYMFNDDTGNRFVVCKGYVLDYTTFCVFVIWEIGGSVAYLKNLANRKDWVDTIKQLNRSDTKIAQTENSYGLVKYMFSRIKHILSNYTKETLAYTFNDAVSSLNSVAK